jgi:hypothetical protein
MPKEYTDHVDDIIAWMQNVADGEYGSADGTQPPAPEGRNWCTLELKDLQPATITGYFDNAEPNRAFLQEYTAVSRNSLITNTPIAYLQTESDMLYALQKSFILRHQTRMSSYRNDCEQKDVRLQNALNACTGKFQHLKDIAI